jgi:hypothetical protein
MKGMSASSKRKRRRRGHRTWVTYWRCFLLTLGAGLISLGGAGLWESARSPEPGPGWIEPLMIGFVVIGLCLLAAGIFGSTKDVEALSGKSPPHEGLLIVAILAAPLYWILSYFERRRRRMEDG